MASVLSAEVWIRFRPLFLEIHQNICARNAASDSEESLRLRVYERLQRLVQAGKVEKKWTELSWHRLRSGGVDESRGGRSL